MSAVMLAMAMAGCERLGSDRAQDATASSSQPAGSTQQAIVRSAGSRTLVLEGVNSAPLRQEPGTITDGPYVFAAIDLDEGQPGDRSTVDVELVIDVRQLGLGVRALSGGAVGDALVEFGACASAADAAAAVNFAAPPFPSAYFCTRTSEGRVSQFRLTRVTAQPAEGRFVDVHVAYEYVTWEP